MRCVLRAIWISLYSSHRVARDTRISEVHSGGKNGFADRGGIFIRKVLFVRVRVRIRVVSLSRVMTKGSISIIEFLWWNSNWYHCTSHRIFQLREWVSGTDYMGYCGWAFGLMQETTILCEKTFALWIKRTWSCCKVPWILDLRWLKELTAYFPRGFVKLHRSNRVEHVIKATLVEKFGAPIYSEYYEAC